MIGMVQNPSLPFDPHHLTSAAYPAMSFPLAPVILLAWAVPFLALIVFAFMSFSGDPERADRYRGRMWVAVWLTGALLAGPYIVSSFLRPAGAGHDQDVVPNVPGYVLTTKPDAAGEFTDWARRRYGVELTNDQATTLMSKKPIYAGRSDNVSNVVLLDGHEVHGLFDGQDQVRLMANGTEMGVKR